MAGPGTSPDAHTSRKAEHFDRTTELSDVTPEETFFPPSEVEKPRRMKYLSSCRVAQEAFVQLLTEIKKVARLNEALFAFCATAQKYMHIYSKQ